MDKKNKRVLIFIISIVASLIVGGLIAVFIIPKIAKSVANWGTNEILTAITLVGVIVALATPILENRFEKKLEKDRRTYEENFENDRRIYEKEINDGEKEALYQIDIKVKNLANKNVLFSAIVENVGDKTIKTKIANLYIDQGIPEPSGNKVKIGDQVEEGAIYYKFPFILEHKRIVDGRPDCILCTRCRDDEDLSYPEEQIKKDKEFKNADLYHTNIPLWHLSDKSISYINPKEKFSEDVIVQFKKEGIYRVTLIVTTDDGEADCECATKQFLIK